MQIAGCQVFLPVNELALADTDSVVTWTDRSGRGNDGSQGTAASRGTFATNQINGQAAISFDGTDDHYDLPGVMSSNGNTAVIVCKNFSDPEPAASEGFWMFNNYAVDGVGTHHGLSSDGRIYESFGATTQHNTGDPTPSLASWHIYGVVAAPSDLRTYLNGVAFYSSGTNTVATAATPHIGRSRNTTTSWYFRGHIAWFAFWDRALSFDDLIRVFRHVNHRFALGFSI